MFSNSLKVQRRKDIKNEQNMILFQIHYLTYSFFKKIIILTFLIFKFLYDSVNVPIYSN